MEMTTTIAVFCHFPMLRGSTWNVSGMLKLSGLRIETNLGGHVMFCDGSCAEGALDVVILDMDRSRNFLLHLRHADLT